jgi:carboxymethylenebutenolidase
VTPEQRQQAIDLYDRFTHDGMERREFMARMTALAGSAAAATAFVAAVSACARSKPMVPERGSARMETIALPGGRSSYAAYIVSPEQRALGTVLVIHENRGLTPHIRDVARRLALAGFEAVAPDFLSPSGGTPSDEDSARAMIGKLDLARATGDAVALLGVLADRKIGSGKVAAIGFCWGGAFVNRLAVAAGKRLAGGVAYYGPAPSPAEAAKVTAPLMLHFAGLDTRVNATGLPWAQALRAAGKRVEAFTYPNVNHAFNNDSSVERYDKPAADLAWSRTLAFLRRVVS